MLGRFDTSIQELDQAVVQEADRHPAAVRLMEYSGIGPVTALAWVLTIGPIERFEKSRQRVSYLGLNPRESSSGGKQRLGSISKPRWRSRESWWCGCTGGCGSRSARRHRLARRVTRGIS